MPERHLVELLRKIGKMLRTGPGMIRALRMLVSFESGSGGKEQKLILKVQSFGQKSNGIIRTIV